MKKTVALYSLIAFLSSGCASMFHGTQEQIHVRSDIQDTIFYADGQEIGKGTSAVTTIPKKKLATTILRGSKKGCNDKSYPVVTQFDGITLLGVLLDFGIISILVVDWGITGAVTNAAQTSYILTPDCVI